MSPPRLRIEPLGAAKRDGDGWRTTWRVVSSDAERVHVLEAVAPHARFRGQAKVDRVARRGRAITFPLIARIDGAAEIENAFVIILVEQTGERWRVLARLRVELDKIGTPRPRIESVTLQRVGFSGEL
jgi:hypothetical protein